MQLKIFLLCSAVWLFWLSCAPGSSLKLKPRQDRQIHQRTYSLRKFCDHGFSSQISGAITQKCRPGFYREWTGLNRGQCVPCSCNGLSNECDGHTGNCVNCQFDTAGDHCERCREGYYGNAANRTCRACACPFTWNNFALACMDIGSGVVECLCRRGYSGPTCERCAYGYYGNPMVHGGSCKPCNCKDGTLNVCDPLTGECIKSGDSSGGDHCHECDSCTVALLVDSEEMDNALAELKPQLQNVPHGPGPLPELKTLEANISETTVLVGRRSSAVRHLHPKVEQLEADVDAIRDDFSQLIVEKDKTESDLEKVEQDVSGTTLKAENLLSEAETLLRTIQDVLKRQMEVKPGDSVTLSEQHKAGLTEEAERILQEARERGCTAERDKAVREQEEAHSLLDAVRNNVSVQAALTQTAASLMASDSSLREVAELLSDANDRVRRTQDLNVDSSSVLQHLEHLHTELERKQTSLRPVTEMTKDVLKNITDTFLMLEEVKKDFESHAAQVDGAQVELSKRLNRIFLTMDVVAKAEEHAEELCRVAAGLPQMLRNATNGTDLLGGWGTGGDSIITLIEKAEKAANQSTEAAERALKEGDLVNRAEGLKDNSANLWAEANDTQSDLHMLSNTVSAHRDRVTKQKEKGQSLRTDISTISDDLKELHRGDTEVLIESAKTAANASKAAVRHLTERLKNISQEVQRITYNSASVNIDDILTDADRALKTLNTSLPVLKDKIAEVEALGGTAPLSANMTESIWRIKDVIEETRNLVKKLSAATTFNGKGHVELHPPRNLEDVRMFTAVDLLLSRHQNNVPKASYRRRRRQDKHRAANSFVFYLGNKNASGDFIGMAIRSNVLICVYKLGGHVQEVETSQITAATKVDFDRVVLHRVYHDAEVNVTQNFTSETPVSMPPKRNLPDKMPSILDLDPGSVVFYVGGYPKDFTPPVELHYPKYKGAMKLSYVNDNPVSLFNYKRAVNMDTKQPAVRIPESEGSYYHDGTGYGTVLVNEQRKKIRLCRFRTNSRDTNALLFYTGNEESFFCVFVERGFLVLQGQQDGRESRIRSPEKVSLSEEQFIVLISDTFSVRYGAKNLTADHRQTSYGSYYIGGLPAHLRQRHNITAPSLRGCVEQLRADYARVQYNRMVGVVNGCPASLLGVRTATLSSALSAESLFDWNKLPLRVSLGFRTTDRHGALLRGSSQGSTSVRDLQLSFSDGYLVFKSDNYTATSDRRYSDGSWHFVSAIRRPTRLDFTVQTLSPPITPVDPDAQEASFTKCITNLYIRRPGQSFIPADLSSFSLMGDGGVSRCLNHPRHARLLPAPASNRPQKHKPILTPTGSQCARRGEHQLSDEHSWVRYTVPQQDLNHRPHFSLDIKTTSSKGLILHVAGRGAVPLLALYVANGKIKMSLGQNRVIQHKQKSNDGSWHRVEFSVEKSTFHLLVDGIRVTDGHLPNDEGAFLDLHNPVYLGSDPTEKSTKEHDLPVNSVIGCIRNFKMNEEVVEKPEASHRALPCFDGLTETGAYFGGGHVVSDTHLAAASQFVLTLELRPHYMTGLLFHLQSHETSLSMFLMESEVGVAVNGSNGAVSVSVSPGESLCDGRFHTVTVSKQHDVIKLAVDSMSEQKAVPFTSSSTGRNTLYFGGTTEQTHVPVSSPFVGCMRNVKLDGKPVDFERSSGVVGPVTVDKCPAD